MFFWCFLFDFYCSDEVSQLNITKVFLNQIFTRKTFYRFYDYYYSDSF